MEGKIEGNKTESLSFIQLLILINLLYDGYNIFMETIRRAELCAYVDMDNATVRAHKRTYHKKLKLEEVQLCYSSSLD